MIKIKPFEIPHERFMCTAVLGAVCALPRKLEGVTAALKLDHQKDKEGHNLMLRWSKPKKPSKKDPSTRYTNNFDRLVKYCEYDIYAETDLLLTLPPLTDKERALWIFDQKINFRGIKIDRDLVNKTLKLIGQEKKILKDRLQVLTEGFVESAGQRAVLLNWLRDNGLDLPNTKAKTVDDAIESGEAVGIVKEVLQICKKLNKTSLRKYNVFLAHTTSDSLARLALNFHAASTGRWGGTGPQFHNLPRGTLKRKIEDDKEVDLAPMAAKLIKNGADLEFIRSIFGDPIEVFVSIIRCMVIPPEGYDLNVADFAAIEARGVFWLADHEEGCKAFREGRKMYEEMAVDIFNVKFEKVTKDQRFVGKQTILGSGYGMGWKKFQSSCADFGQEVSDKVAKDSIRTYREKHKPVVTLWSNIEKAAISAVKNPRKTFKINHTEWFMDGKFLCVRLPSGRCLRYYGPSIRTQRTPWGTKTEVLYHWGVNSKTKKWEMQKTWGGTLVENVVQGICRDLMALAMTRIEKAGYKIILTVHDEILGLSKKGFGSIEEFVKLMEQVPKWAEGFPIKVEGWRGDRYRK